MHLLFTVFLCLLLCGCSDQPELLPEPTQPAVAAAALEAVPYGNAATAYALPVKDVEQLYSFAEGLLLKSNGQLLLLDRRFQLTSAAELDYDPVIQVCGDIITAFDPESGQLSLLDSGLSQLRCITLPPELSGSPILSSDGKLLYYATSRGIYGWDLDSGIRRRIRESAGSDQWLVGIHWEDQVLQCRIQEGSQVRDLFLDAEHGQLLQEIHAQTDLQTSGKTYYCSYTSGTLQNLIFGSDTSAPRALFPEDPAAEGIFVPEHHGAVTLSSRSDGTVQLDLYSLDTGAVRDSLLLNPEHRPRAILSGDEDTLLLLISGTEGDLLLQWHLRETPRNGKDHTDFYATADAPDHAGLSLCRDYAQRLSDTYGVEILFWKEAAAAEPWDYTFEAEHRYPVILQQLQTLEECLSQYPESVLRDTAAHFDALKICLVGRICSISEETGPADPTGIQFFDENSAYVVLAAGPYARQALYHELFHVMETHILCSSSALDRWEELNPSGFSYDLDHSANARRNSGVYLERDTRAFIDTYSMSFPKEDRARVFEYAMLPDQAHLFQTDILQNKLNALCKGIREAYGLKKREDTFPWEQYLT